MNAKFENPVGFGSEPKVVYAVDPAHSKGRFHEESEKDSPTRTPYQRDRDRIVHSTAFRRLKHKTQVFVYHEGDHFRTRLTHTIEVAQVARSIARALCLDEDLTEALALAHDLGHPPFGHEGERILDDCLKEYGGFDHNAQSFRVVTKLESRYAEFDGLNLTWETLEGLVKHNGPLIDRNGNTCGKLEGMELPFGFSDCKYHKELMLWSWPSAEAQVAAIADDIAYNSHDIDDGLRANLYGIEDIRKVSLVGGIISEVDSKYPGLDSHKRIHEIVRRIIIQFVEDVIQESMVRLNRLNPRTPGDIREANESCVNFSETMAKRESEVKDFLYEKMYRHPEVIRVRESVAVIVRNLFGKYMAETDEMSQEWREGLEEASDFDRARRVADYIAGMTDRYAVEEHRRMFGDAPDLN